MTPRDSDRQGFLSRSCPKNRGLFQAINGYSGVVMPVLAYLPRWNHYYWCFCAAPPVLSARLSFVVMVLSIFCRPRNTALHHSAKLFQIASILAFVSSSMRISSGHGLMNPSDFHFRVASIPIFDP